MFSTIWVAPVSRCYRVPPGGTPRPIDVAERSSRSESDDAVRPKVKPGKGPSLDLVTIGINKYQREAMNLKYAAPDARALGKLFRERGPQMYGAVRVKEILDEHATKDNIQEAIEQVAKSAKPTDTLIVFLAGT